MSLFHRISSCKLVTIMPGNTKLGRGVWNISMPPVKTCDKGLPCYRDCYAMKMYRLWPRVRQSWDGNLAAYLRNPAAFFAAIAQTFEHKQPVLFRWEVSGDFPDAEYFARTVELAQQFPPIKFLAFTKKYAIVNDWLTTEYSSFGEGLPDNYRVLFSAWPSYPLINPYRLPVAWMQDGTEERVPADSLLCSGHCSTCGQCWELQCGQSVVLEKH